MTSRFLLWLGAACASWAIVPLGGCSSSPAPVAQKPSNDAGTPDTCDKAKRTCEGDSVRECIQGANGRYETRLRACADEAENAVCREGACVSPTDAQLVQAGRIDAMLDQLSKVTGYPFPIDYTSLKTEARRELFHADGSDRAFFQATYRAFLGVPQGHQSFVADNVCGKAIPYASTSRFGVCGRPGDGGNSVVVTLARGGNKLGIAPGDRVTKVELPVGTGEAAAVLEGPTLLAFSARALKCGASHVSASFTQTEAAASFFGVVPASAKLTILSPTGESRIVVIPAEADAQWTSCSDPLGRDLKVVAEARTLADGTAVIRIPAFTPFDEQLPANPTLEQYDDFRQRFEDRIYAEFVKVQNAPRLVWDLRSNGGGMTAVGLAILAGMPGATGQVSTYCNARVPKSDPPTFSSQKYAEYALVPGGRFAYAGKVAMLVDGFNYSAADYTPYFAKNATQVKLVGSPTAGAFGGAGLFFRSPGLPAFTVYYDNNKCMDSAGNPLEGKSVEPHILVEYDPIDLAAGKDTVLERALVELK
ncbi:MAG: S41 family peptidase [Polyangiaceae bacterium]